MKKVNVKEFTIGVIILIAAVVAAPLFLESDMLVFRWIMGISLGYVLSRAYTGFAGSVNRAYNTGSTKLMRAMVYMFFISAVIVAGILMFADISEYNLWVNPINLGLILGGLLFGFGMTFSSCCASGVMTDLVTDLPKALITLLFFGMGVFLGMPIQNSASWINESWFASSSFENGVFLPDLFKGTPLNGYLGALIVTGILCLIAVVIAYAYEAKRKREKTYAQVPSEAMQAQTAAQEMPIDNKDGAFNNFIFNKIFIDPWSLKTGAVLLTVLFSVMMVVTKAGWGASTPYGHWFGKLLMLFGVSADSIANFTKGAVDPFVNPLLSSGVTVQNFGIVVGTLVYMLMSGQMAKTAKGFFNYPKWQYLLFVAGGLLMGFGTRLSNGCNVGALYTPIANFSLSGWVFFVFLVLGGIAGNKFQSKLFDKMS